MFRTLDRAGQFLLTRSENVAVVLMCTMMGSFLYQVVSRYLFNNATPWAEEICVICWIWSVLWCSAFVVRPDDDIRIDLITVAASPMWRRVIEGACSIVIIVLFLIGLPGAWNYVTFMKVETTAALGWRFNWVFSVYILFACAVIVRQSWALWYCITGRGKMRYVEGREDAEI